MKYHFFISYADKDQAIVNELYDILKDKKFNCFIAHKHIKSSSEWAPEIQNALNESESLIVIVTNAMLESKWVFVEIGAAWSQKKHIYPLIQDTNIDHLNLPEPLRYYQAVDINTYKKKEEFVNDLLTRTSVKEEYWLKIILQKIQTDLYARIKDLEQKIETKREYFITEISRCNLDKKYYIEILLKNKETRIKDVKFSDQVEDWIEQGKEPFLFVIGSAGIGKTNSLIAEVVAPIVEKNIKCIEENKPVKHAVIFIPLGSYDPNIPFWLNFEKLIKNRVKSPVHMFPQDAFKKLLLNGDIVLILDGLDEFVRIHGDESVLQLMAVLQEYIDNTRSIVIFSCRDHVYKKLKELEFIQKQKKKVLKISRLEKDEVLNAVKKRFSDKSIEYKLFFTQHLYRYTRKPLLLEMMFQIPSKEWEQFADKKEPAYLYDFWFNQIIKKTINDESHLLNSLKEITDKIAKIRYMIGEISIYMLEIRSDECDENKFQNLGLLPKDIDPKKRKLLGIFIKQTKKTWGFIHDSFREFSLANAIAEEYLIASNPESSVLKSFNFLSKTSCYDYAGSDMYRFVYHIFTARDKKSILVKTCILKAYQEALVDVQNTTNETELESRQEKWNTIIRNCYETIGFLADFPLEDITENKENPGFIDITKSFLFSKKTPSKHFYATYKTKYNILRALERLHSSREIWPCIYIPYKEVNSRKTIKSAPYFGAVTVAGTHMKTQGPGLSTRLRFKLFENDYSDRYQLEISEWLINLLDSFVDENALDVEKQDSFFLRINASYALIRWLHGDHINKLKNQLKNKNFDTRIKGNIFLALFRLKNENKAVEGNIFKQFPQTFDNMELFRVSEDIKEVASSYYTNVAFKQY